MKESAYAEEGYKKFDVKSGGADSPRQVVLRSKPSTGQWFLWDQFLLSGIRKPKNCSLTWTTFSISPRIIDCFQSRFQMHPLMSLRHIVRNIRIKSLARFSPSVRNI